MALMNEYAMPRRRLQYRLGTLLITVAALCLVLAAGHWLGWQALCGFLFLAGFLGAIGLTLLPVTVLVLCWAGATEQLGKLFVVAGCVLLFHLIVTAVTAELALRPWFLDPKPFDYVMLVTLNWTVPAAAIAVLMGFLFTRGMSRPPWYRLGTTLTAVACLAFVCYGRYFFGHLICVPMAEYVWWL